MATVKARSKNEYKNSTQNVSAGFEGGSSCVVSHGTKIEGNFHSAENIRLDGGVKGELKCDKKLVLGQQGIVTGNIMAADAVIMGQVKGDISISGLLQLEKSAVIEGNIAAGRLIVEEGARYDGMCKVG